MKKILLVLISALVLAGMFSCRDQNVPDKSYIIKIGDTLPDFAINEAGGKSYMLSDLKGKVVMLQFTASWCSVCRKEMPHIEKEIWQEKKNDGLVVIGIDRDEPEDTVIRFRNEMGISYPLALDPGAKLIGLVAVKDAGVTRNVILDRNGKVIFLTRLYNPREFKKMKKCIFSELDRK